MMAAQTQLSDDDARAWMEAFVAAGGYFLNWDGVLFFQQPFSPEPPEMAPLLAKLVGELRLRVNALARRDLGMDAA
jgi:hypothetical protein